MSTDVSLILFHVFDYALDLILVIGLLYYFGRLGYAYLKYGAIAIGTGLVCEVLQGLGIVPVDNLLARAPFELVFAVAITFCALDLAGRRPARSWLAGMAVGSLVVTATVLVTTKVHGWPAAMLMQSPPGLFLLYAAGIGFATRERSMGMILFCTLVALAGIGSVFGGLLTRELPQGGQLHLLVDLLRLLLGVSLVMITSERAIADLARQQVRIDRFAEDRRRLELQFSHAQKMESLGMLAGGIAHDFNNMLTSILGYATLAMKKLPPDSEVRKDLYMVMSGARQAVDLTSQMLIYAGKGALEFEAVDISKVVQNMSSLIDSIVPRETRVVQRLGDDLPSLKGDKVQLGQVVMNLIANAVDAVQDSAGTIEVVTGLAEVDEGILRKSFFAEEREPGAYLFLRIRDTGIGMTEDQVERIFDPFYSEKLSNKGLGLSSLSGIVRQHKGFVHVTSTPGEGTDFMVYFPVVAVTDTFRETTVVPVSRSKEKGRVLLADDDSRIRSLMVSILESDHYTVVSAEDGREALSLWRESQGDFDLLVLDCTMPKMSGTDVYREIRSDGVLTPVVLVSGYHQEQVSQNIESDPNGRFVKKPFNVDDFLAEVAAALSQGGSVKPT